MILFYLGALAATAKDFSGLMAGLGTFSKAGVAIDFRLKASSIFSTCINWPPSPLSAMNLRHRYKVHVTGSQICIQT